MNDKVPKEWRWSLWERAKEPHSRWHRVIEYTQEFVDKTKRLLTSSLGHRNEYVVCQPGSEPEGAE